MILISWQPVELLIGLLYAVGVGLACLAALLWRRPAIERRSMRIQTNTPATRPSGVLARYVK